MVEQETWLTGISIHAPHARSDATLGNTDITFVNISIHAPHARSDILLLRTCSVHCLNFNPRSSCEERPPSRHANPVPLYFNPRSSCEERRVHARENPTNSPNFNPRSSCEERQRLLALLVYGHGISIHAPHARSDRVTLLQLPYPGFQSTLLMRGATRSSTTIVISAQFQSTLLMRGATGSHCGGDDVMG